ncbi:hypothetical protein [uncultured Pseudoteredinibacter sp.]|uniref:hypothetical protein n=1 Tax=uncultured Pseudoteredinibacter sp. TaxID=1641701 RepID=UPI0026053F36|nr:hypothetical protein [uncultured Pseudoteredinibacter sp.]
MVAQVQNTQSENTTSNRIGNWQAVLLFAVIALPMVLALLIYKTGIGMPAGTINEGLMLSPAKQINVIAKADNDGHSLLATGKKWRLVIPYSQNCDRACASNLYITRQVHIRLGEKARRVERVLLSMGADKTALEKLLQEHPRMRVMNIEASDFSRWLSESSLPESVDPLQHYLLVDEDGFAMMAYNTEHEGNQLLKDIKRVLKFTNEE